MATRAEMLSGRKERNDSPNEYLSVRRGKMEEKVKARANARKARVYRDEKVLIVKTFL